MTGPHADAVTRPGCLASMALFAGVWAAGAMTAMLIYVLLVEQWSLIEVRREFSYDMAFLWAPLVGLITAIAVSFWNLRGGPSRGRTAVLSGVAALVAFILLMLFTGLGAFF